MVLVPEISLTPQLLRVFASHFGELVAVLHSSLRSGERYDEWKRVRSGAARVVLGTRSAVFAPLDHIGLIVLDEEQESSYKSENAPRYHARDVAKYRCVQHRAVLLLGSATPAVESMYQAREGRYRLFTLSQRFNQQAMPQVRIVDMKRELRAGNCTAISAELRRELACQPGTRGAEHPVPEPPGQQPHGLLRGMRTGPGVPTMLGAADLPLRQRKADVPLLRLF